MASWLAASLIIVPAMALMRREWEFSAIGENIVREA
jgi:hypothetical protein